MGMAYHCPSLSDNAAARPTSGRCLTPFAGHVQSVAGHASAHFRFALTEATALVITGNRFKPEVSGAFDLSSSMRKNAVYAKGGAASHRRASMHKLTKPNVVERAINRLKDFRAVATRYEKRGHHYLAVVTIATMILWLL